jgi:hypothetical protein
MKISTLIRESANPHACNPDRISFINYKQYYPAVVKNNKHCIAKNSFARLWAGKLNRSLAVILLSALGMIVMPRLANAQVTQPIGWTNIYSIATGTASGNTVAIASGSNRILVVGITTDFTSSGTANDPTTITYGGVTLTKAVGDGASSGRMHTWLYFLKDNAIMNGSPQALNVTMGSTSQTIANMTVWYTVFAGVDQTASYTTGNGFNNSGASGPAQLSAGQIVINANEQAVYISSIFNDNTTTPPTYTINGNWTSAGTTVGSGSGQSWKNEAAKRTTIPVSSTTDNAATSAITPSGNIRYAMSAMSLPKFVITYTSITNGAWSDPGTWDLGSAPAAGSNVIIAGGTSVNLTGNTNTINSLTVNGTLDVSTFSLTGANIHTVSATGTLLVGGANFPSGFVTTTLASGSTVNYNGGVQNISNQTYSNLILSGSGAKTLQTGTTSITGTLTLSGTATTTTVVGLTIGNLNIGDGTTFTAAGFALTVSGTTTVGGGTNGNFAITSTTGTKTFTGLVTINTGGIWTNTVANSAVTFRGGITNNGTFNSGTGVHTFDNNSQQLTGTFTIPSITVTGVTVTNNNTLTVATALSGSGGVTQAANATLNIGGTSGITTLSATNSGNTVNYTGGVQIVHSNNYVILTLTGSGAKTLQTGTTSVTGNLTLTGTATTTTVAGLTIGGNLSIADGTTFTAAGFALTVTGTTTVGAGVSGNLTISSATGIKIFTGLVTISTGGVWNNSGNSPVTFRGGIANNGTFTAGTGVHTFDTNAQALSGNAFTIPSVTITGITLTNNNSLTVNTALSGTGTLLQATAATLNIGAASALSNMNAAASGNNVNYTAATGGQTLIGGTYFNVNLNNTSGTNTANGNVSVTGAMIANGGASGTLNMSTFTLAGTTITNNGTINTQNTGATPIPSALSWGGTINYNAAAGNQTVVIGTYTNLTSGNTSGINSAAGNLVINGILTTTALGTLSLGTNTISGTLTTINNNGTISTANTTATPLPTGLTWGGTINYNALTGAQTIVDGTYNNLTLGNTSGSSSPGNDLVVNGVLTTAAGGTLDLTTFALTGTLSSVVNNGTIITANISATPVPSGKTWSGSFIYAGAASQTVVAGTYSNLNITNTAGAALSGAVTINTSLSLSSSLTLGANNFTLGFTGAVTGVSSSVYIITNSTGQLKRTVAGSPVNFPVGNSAYNPITFTNTGTADVYGIIVVDGAVTTAIDPSLTVDRRWQITETVAGGSNLAITAQYNSGETTVDFSAGNPIIGLYNGTVWVKTTATYSGGSSPFTFTSLSNLTPANLTTGTQYLALGKDYAFVAGPTQFAITSIVPNPVISGSGFQVTVMSQNAANEASNVTTQTFFNLSTNGNAGALSGTISGSIPAGQSSVTLNGVVLSALGTGVTITATLDNTNGGDALTPGTSAPFNVAASATSDIVTAGNETPNIDYNSKTGSAINTTSDAIRVWSFSVRDGGSTPDADNLATILSAITITKGGSNTVTSWANSIQEAALFDGSTKVAEITVAGENLVFSSLNSGAGVTAADNSSTTLDLYLTFKTANTDGQRLQFAITNANISATAAGSLFNSFATTNSSVTGNNNRIQVIASKLVFGAQALTDVAVGMSMSPAFTIRGVDANNNLDIDYTSTITLAVNGSTFNGAAPGATATTGIATFSPAFATTGSGVTVTGSDGVITATPPSNTFNVTSIVPATTDLFRSKTTGDWDQITTWQESHDGNSWFDAAVTPTNANSSSIAIQNTHVVTVATPVTIDQTTVIAGGAITVNSGQRLDVADGATDLIINGNVTVNGSLRLANNATITSTAASLAFNSGGTYEHNYTTASGTIPTATWNAGSTCSIIGYTTNTTAPGGLTQTFSNFTWSCTSQGANTINLNSQLTTVQGDFSVLSTGTAGIIALMNSASFTITIGGNLTVGSGANQASLDWFTGNNTPTMNLAGNISIGSAGTIIRSGSNSTPVLNFNKASGIQTYNSANAAGISNGRFNANVGTGTSTNTLQLLSDFAMNSSGSGTLTVFANATLDCVTRIVTSSGANFTMNSGSSIITANTQGLAASATTGSIQVQGSRNYNGASNYIYNGTAAQITGNALTTANNLTINNTAGVTLTSATTVNGTLTLTSGLLTIGTNNLTIGAAGSISGASSTVYVNTNSTGLLRRTVAGSPVTFPVGTTAYNPITLTNTGTSDIYGITEIDGTVPSALDATFTVNRRWRVIENSSGGSNLAVVGQYNSGEVAANFNTGIIPKIGFYNGTVWTENAATQAGAGPFTFTSNANFTPTNLTTGTQYFALGKDQAFAPIPQGTLTANSICDVGTGQLTFTATAGTAPFTVVYNDGTNNVTQNNVASGTPFNVTPNPTITTTYTLVSVTDNDGDVRNSGFTGGGTATITVNPAVVNNTVAASQSICSGTTPAAMTGSVPTGGNDTYNFLWQSSTTNATTGFANAAGTNTGQNYTPPGNITQTTWYRRVVTSNGCTDNSTAIQVTITPAPIITPGPTLTATQSCTPVAVTLTGASFTAPATSAAWSIISGGGTLSTTALTASPSTVTYTPASGLSGAVTLALTTDVCPTLSAARTINVNLPTIVNYDFNTGSSFATLVSNAAPNITATPNGTTFATSTTSTVTGGQAFTTNSTGGNSLSQTATANNNWTFSLTGTDVRFYKTYKVYFNGQRNSGTTPQNINVLYSIDGGANYISVGNTALNNLGTWVEAVYTLPVAVDNQASVAIKLNVAAGNGTLLIDNFQMQAVYTPPADKTPVAAASPICEGTSTNIQIPASQLGVNYQLRNNIGNVTIGSPVTGTGSTINLPTGTLTSATTFNVLASNSCSVQMANTVTVNITPLATLSSSLTAPAICTNTAFSYTPTSTTLGTTFNWSRAVVAGISNSLANGTGNPNETLINTTTAPINVTYAYSLIANGCTNPTVYNVVVVVNPTPTLTSTLTPPAVCDGNPFQYIPTSATPGAIFNWSRAVVAGISNSAATGTDDPNETLFNTTSDPVNVTYQYTLLANSCANPTAYNVVVAIEPSPSVVATDTVVSNTAGVCGASITLGNNVITNGTLSFSVEGNPITFPHTFPTGTTNVTVTAENNCGTSTTFFDVTVNDTEAPVVPTLSDVTGECSATATAPTTTDNCAGTITGTTPDPLTYSAQGNYVIHWSFDDGNGNISTATQNVIVQDVTPPAIPVLNNVTGECSATATAPVATDNCVGPITGTTTDPLTYLTQGTHVIHWSFDDGRGNISTATQNVVVQDVTPPAIPSLANVTGECSATATTPTTTDNCSGTITGTTTDPLSYSTQGTHVIHWSFDDGNGNISTATQNVIISDVTPPAVPVLSNITGECSATATAPTTTDNCSGTITGTTTDPLTWSTQGTHVIHWSFDDGNGNISTANQNVVISDVTPPDVPVLPDVTGECSATATAPTTTDNCSGTITGTTTDALIYSTQGTHVIHWSFDDGNGNISTANQNVVINDVTPPAVPVLNDVTGECSATATAPTTTDNCSGTITGTTTDALTYSTQGTHVIHWSFDDGNGNISTANQNVVINDVTPPAVPVLNDVTGECSATATAPTTTDNCSGTITGTTTDPLTYTTQGTHIIHWSFDDANGNISTATQNVVVDDVTPPAVPVLSNITGECSATATASTTTDNCSGTITGTTTDPLTYTTQGTHIIHWSFDDANGNISTANQNVVINDVTAPAVPVLTNLTAECSVTATAPTTTDNCYGTITGTTTDPLTYSTQGTHVIHWSFDDGNGNISTANQNVIITDNTPPDVPVLTDVTGECSASATAPTTTDNCSGTITGTTTDALSYSTQGTHVIHWSFDDGNGNISTANQNVVINDITPPAVPVLSNVTDECSATATVPTTTDNCSGSITGTTTDQLTYSTQGTHVIHWSFDDGNGNISTANQNVVINDVTPPPVPTLADVTGECSATATAPTTTDNCSGTITGTTTDPLTYSTQGTHVIHWSFDDGNGNISTATQNVVINDITPPAAPVLSSINGECTATATAPTTTDNCAGTITGTTTDPLTYSTNGTHVIHWSFDDGNGNISTATQNVIINDVTPPAIPVLANVTGECSATATAPTTTDNCAGIITGTTTDPLTYATSGTHVIHWSFDDGNGNISTATQNVIINDVTPPAIPVLANVTGECSATATAPTTTDNCAGTITGTTTDPLTYSTQGTHVIHWSFDDGNGNISIANQNVIINDITPPAVPVLANVTGECSATATAPTTTDNCSGTITGTTTDPLTYSQGTHVIHWSFDDGHGNISTANQNVIIQDVTGPTVNTAANSLNAILECDNTAGLTQALVQEPAATDNCSPTPTIHLLTDVTTQDPLCPNGYTRVRTWNFTDVNNNPSANFVQTITVQDHTPPFVVQMPADVTVNSDANCQATGVNLGILSAQDNCSAEVTITNDHPSIYPIGNTIVTWTIKDACNNTITRQQTVRVLDHTNPVIANCPADITVFTGPGALTCTKGVSWTPPSASDNCSVITSFTSNYNPGAVFPAGTTLVTYVATDASTNSSTCSFNVTVVDNTVPVINNCPANIVTCNPNVTWTAPTATDNCGVTTFTNDAPASFPVGVTTVIYTAKDAANNTTTCSFTVTVNPTPSALAASNSPICSGNSLSLSSAGGTSYAWTGPNSFTSNLQNPSIAFATTAATGTYTVVVSNNFGCSATTTTNVVVNAGATATAGSNSPVCTGGTLSLTATGGVSYNWSGPNGFVSLQQNPTISNITNAAGGIYTVTVTNASGCTAQAFTSVSVGVANAFAANNGPLCEGATLSLSAAGGTSYLWSGPNGFNSIQQNPAIANVTTAAGGTYTVTVTGSGGCTATTTTNVTVNANPIALASNNSPVCQSGTLSLSAGGGTSYSWTGPNSFSSLQQNPVISNITPAAAGFYTVTVANAAGCSSTAITQVSVNAASQASAASNSPVCTGGTLTLFASAGASYSWTGPNSFSSIAQNPILLNVTNTANGIYTVTVTSASGCTSTAATNVIISTLPIASASANSPLCEGATLSLSASGGGSYSWTGPNGFLSNQQNPSLGGITTAATGTYTVTVMNGSNCSASTTVFVQVNANPVTTASSNSPICAGTNLNLFANGGASYSWTGPNGFSSTQQNPLIANAALAAGGTYTVVVTNANGCTSTTTTNVTVNNGVIASASSNSPVCTGVTLNLFANGGVSYNWSGPNGFLSSQQNPTIANVTTAAGGTYTVTVTNAGGCTATITTNITVNNGIAAVASSNSPVCTGVALNLFASGGTSYSWNGPNGFLSAQQNPTISNVTTAAGGTYTVTVTNANGCTSTITTNVTVNNGAAPIASSTTPVCTGGTLNLFATGGVSYSWTGPNGFLSTDQNPVISNIAVAAGGIYTVTVTTLGGCTGSTTTTAVVNVGSVGGNVSGTTAACSGSNSGTMNLTGQTGNVIRWESSTDNGSTWSTISNTTTSQTYTNLTQTTQYRAVVQGGSCTSANSAAAIITVNGAAVGGNVTASANVCSGNNAGTLTLSGQSGAITKWQFSTDGGGTWTDIANTTTSQAYSNLTQTTQYRAVIAGCSTVNSGAATITMAPASVGGSVSGTTAVCSGSNSGTMNLSGHTGNVIRWEMSTDGGDTWSTISNTTTSQTYTNLTQTTQYRALVQNGSCTSANSATAIITVNATAAGGTVSGSTTVCTGNNSGTVSLSGQAGSIIKWQFSTDGGGSWTDIANTTTSQSYSNLTQPTQYRAVINGCSTVNSSAATITVTPASVGGTLSGSAVVCSGSNSGTMNLTGQTGNVIRWEFSTDNGSTWSTISNTTTAQTYTNLTQTRQYRAVVLSGVCVSANSAVAIITVNSSPVGGTVSGSTTICSGSNSGTVTLSGQTGAITKWQFSINNGGSWTDIVNTTTTQAYSNLTQTTQYRAVIGGCATTVNSSAATITIGSSLAVSIAASDAANEFCNKLTLTANASAPVQSYLWSNTATTQSIKLGGANAAGNYTVTVTAVGGCTGTATYNYAPQALISNYTILGLQTVTLAANNTVQNGSVGATPNNGTITIGNTTSVAGPGAFVKAQTLTISASANVPVRINAPAAVPLPVMQYNTTSTSALGNVSVPNNTTGTLNGNYRNLTIGTNCNVILTGTIYRLITVSSGSMVRFSQPVVNIGGINLDQGSISSPTTVAFSQACIVRSNADINMASMCSINPDNYKVVFYIGVSSGNSSPDFNVSSGGNVTVNANIYVPNGDISVGGNNTINTFMNGKFIASLVKSTGQRVIWNSFDCGTANLITRTTIGNGSQATIIPIIESIPSFLTASVTPVPTESFFTLRIKSSSQDNVVMKIYDIVGRQIEQFNGSPDQAYRFGNRYMQGTYIVEVHQGSKVRIIQVVKL